MSIVNSCSTVGSNLGDVSCQGRRETPSMFMVGGKQFSAAEYGDSDTMQAAVVAATKLSTGDPDKLYAFPIINKVTNSTEANSTGSLALGPVVRLRKGRPSYTYVMQDLTQFQYENLLAFDNKVVPVFTYDDGSQYWGYRAGVAANVLNTNPFSGEIARIEVSGNGFKDSENIETGQAVVVVSYLSISDFEKRAAYISLPNFSTGDVAGLQDVSLIEPVAHVSNVHSLKAYIKVPQLGGDIDLGPRHGTALAALTWTAFTGVGFATSLVLTSVAYTAGKLVFTFDSTAYTALAALSKIRLVPPTVTVMDNADITEIEIGSITLTK